MFQKTNVTLESCDHALAITFSQMPALLGERQLKPARLDFLRKHIKGKTFISPTWAVVVDKTTGTRYRANGQHSSTVLAELTEAEWQTSFPEGLMVTIEEYTTDNLAEDGYMIFDMFDNPVSARANIDVMNFYRVRYEDLKDISNQVLMHLMAGVALHQKSVPNGIFLAARDRGLYLENEENRHFAIWAAPFAKALHAWMLGKAGIVAEMVAQRRLDQEMADKFWQLVFNESHEDPDHETRELSRTLKDWASKPKISQDRFRKETAKRWRSFRLAYSTPPLELNYDDRSTAGPAEATL
jgi:hypothetical protein